MPQARGSVAPGAARPVSGDRPSSAGAAATKPRRAASTGRFAVRTSTSPSAASAGSLASPSTAPSSARSGGGGGGGIRRRTAPPAAPAGAELVPVSVVSAWLESELETWVRDLDTLVYSLLDDDADAALRYVVERRNAAVKQTSLFERHEGGGGGGSGHRAAGAGGEVESPLAPLTSLEQLAAGKRRRSLEGMQECAERFVAMKRRLRLKDACSGGAGSVAAGAGGVDAGSVRAAHLNKPRPLQPSLVADSALLYGRRASSAGAGDAHSAYRPGASDASHDGDGSEVTPGVSAAAAAAQQAATAATAGRPTATASSLYSSYHGSDGPAMAASPNCYSVASSAPVGVSDLRGFAPAEEASVPAAAVPASSSG
eukprot:Rhum_TRINITY_DN14488_c10_g2::Rhum_TRINITY_DN14488_c10_g2_i1::g.92652::m.92652